MMAHAKNYETMSTFVKVMQKKLWPLFFRTRCTSLHSKMWGIGKQPRHCIHGKEGNRVCSNKGACGSQICASPFPKKITNTTLAAISLLYNMRSNVSSFPKIVLCPQNPLPPQIVASYVPGGNTDESLNTGW